ncbi:LysR substrate-binding domain-containing protein [Terrilactibacillus tamarindi]|uniref:LysR substrate-binding domain-containing protein n=1 Tax=Terrilactibacillus tamarindi TaxID=2599694 RepID=UPI002E310284|nr:LysR substrate-binding domain-containing protein [Terrilactibacillus tamarindi]
MATLSLVKFEILKTVIDLGSITRAGERLNLTQSAISHAVTSLEKEYGFSLLTRSRSGIKLTPNGREVLLYIEEMLHTNEKMKQVIAEINGLEIGTVTIGTFSSVSVQWLPDIIRTFKQQFPRIEVKLLEGGYQEIHQWILNGDVDFGFVSLPISEKFDVITLKKDKMLCILPQSHPLSQNDVVSFSDLRNEPFIMPMTKGGCGLDVRRVYKKHRFTPKTIFELKDDQAIISMVNNGLGVSILPEMVLSNLPSTVLAVNIEGKEDYRLIGMAAHSFQRAAPATQKFIKCVENWIKEQE